MSRTRQNRNDAQDLLFLHDYAHKVAHAQQTLEEICNSLHQVALLSGIISAQDLRSLQTAGGCLNSLRIRVTALANVTEQVVITKQLQLIHDCVQVHRPKDPNKLNLSDISVCSLHHYDANKDLDRH